MTRFKRAKLHLGKTVNIGNFESIRVDVGSEEDVLKEEENEWYAKEMIDLVEQLKHKIRKAVLELKGVDPLEEEFPEDKWEK